MGKRGKDKRSKELMEKFHSKISEMLEYERLMFIYENNKPTNYIISSKGTVYIIDKNNTSLRIIKPFINKDGHLRVGLIFEDGVRCKKFVHRLVAEAFVPNIENKPIVHHINGDTLNNRFDNLMWVTHKEHVELTSDLDQYIAPRGSTNPSSVYTDEQIELALSLMVENELYPDEICKKTGISYSTFQHLRLRESAWSYLKEKYDISNYNKFRRLIYTDEQRNEFIKIRNNHPDYSLRKISNILGIKYETIKTWNLRYKK